MTTTVKIEAHCDPKTTEVKVLVSNEGTLLKEESVILQDGDRSEVVLYDGRAVLVEETPKKG